MLKPKARQEAVEGINLDQFQNTLVICEAYSNLGWAVIEQMNTIVEAVIDKEDIEECLGGMNSNALLLIADFLDNFNDGNVLALGDVLRDFIRATKEGEGRK